MRKYHTHVREKKAVEYVLRIEDLEKYKNAWLVLSNNAREYPDHIYKVYNNSHSDIYVLCNPNGGVDHESFLSQYGPIVNIWHDKTAVFVDVTCDYDDFDKDYVDSEYVFGELD